ncbi:MAG: T9SS type A sorting domain-containing protein [Saprospiraceae bacterium]|nr:T9SS type A sorting domain-containing protein [Saprospiraceae bacterium]
MKKTLPFLAILLIFNTILYSQTTLYSESFETDGEGVRYVSNTYNDCATISNPDYFLRTNTNPVFPPGTCMIGFGNALTNIQGSWFWAGEDIRSNLAGPPGARPPGDLTTQSINISSYNNLTVSFFLATASNNGTRWEWDDSINVHASLNNGAFKTVGRFVGGALSGGDLRQDLNLDGMADGAIVSTSNFTKYTFNIPGTGTSLKVRLDFDQFGGTEESAIDLIEVQGTLVLPVELLRFDAIKAGDAVDLKWSTALERNNGYFAIERGRDPVSFREIGKVNAGESQSGIKNYAWTDLQPMPDINYYRLRQYDTDGSSSISATVQVQMGHPEYVLGLSPNPAKTQTTLQLQQEKENQVRIVVYDLNGTMQQQMDILLKKGRNDVNIPLDVLKNGVYHIRVESEGQSGYVKLIKIQD